MNSIPFKRKFQWDGSRKGADFAALDKASVFSAGVW